MQNHITTEKNNNKYTNNLTNEQYTHNIIETISQNIPNNLIDSQKYNNKEQKTKIV